MATGPVAASLRTRFAAPSYNCVVVRRTRLEERLRDAMATRAATLVSAPAGYGKSLLVAAVCAALDPGGERTVWIQFDPRDNSYERIIETLDDALRPGAADKGSASAVVRGGRRGAAAVGSYLFDWLRSRAESRGGLVLVLDDYEVVEDPAVHDLFDSLIRQAIPDVHIVILSRTQPPLSLSVLRHRGQLCEIGRADLAFSADEIAELIQGRFSRQVTPENLRIIGAKTEGWPVALQLVGAALSQRDDANAFVSELSGCDSDVADFLSREVLARHPAELVEFLIQVSPLVRISDDLCTAITGLRHSSQLLHQAVRSHLLLFPTDRNGTWFRFHPLFRDFLIGQMPRYPQIHREEILRAAVGWCEKNGYPADAINYALELSDARTAIRLITQYAERFVYERGEHAQFLKWMDTVGGWEVHGSFDLAYWHAWALIISHRIYEASHVLRYLERSCAAAADAAGDRHARARVEIIRVLVMLFSDRLGDCVNAASEWLDTYTDSDPFDVCSMATTLAEASCATGEFAVGRSALQTAQLAAESARSPYATSWVGAVDGHLAMAVGDFPRARRLLTKRFESVSAELGYSSSALSTTSLLLAGTCYELGDLVDAARYLKFGLSHIKDHGLVESAAAGFRVLIRTKERVDGFDAALEACYDCEQWANAYGPRLTLMLLYEYCCLALRHGQTDKAYEAAGFEGGRFVSAALSRNESAEGVYGLVAAIIRIRVLMAAGRADAAAELIAPWLAVAAGTNRKAFKVELLILRSRVEALRGEVQRSRRTLLEALMEAAPLGMVQIFADEGDQIRALLEAAMPMFVQNPDAKTAFVNAIGRLVSQAGQDDPDAADRAVPYEPLSDREIQILQLIDTGLTNKEVASRLLLSLRTVKWYLYNIYPKLGVKNRTGAVAKARALGLL
ncbi:MAG: LuxR C-terminal-related transcriptional regulator [Nevskiales bacterium]|nr:LuxR C-terminal-related transcriptional regulator [Nevskiales bacterium]